MALKKTPAEVRDMTFPQYYDLCEYWRGAPPEHESLAMLLGAFTTWEPDLPRTAQEHMASLERRWRSGQYMNPRQMFEAMRGAISVQGGPGDRQGAPLVSDGTMPGIGPFPGSPAALRLAQEQRQHG